MFTRLLNLFGNQKNKKTLAPSAEQNLHLLQQTNENNLEEKKADSITSDLQKEFFTNATNGNGIIIGVCTGDNGGCHDFAKALSGQFSNLDTASIKSSSITGTAIFNKPTQQSTNWNFAAIVGCCFAKGSEYLLVLKNDYRFTGIKSVYLIMLPHIASTCSIYHETVYPALKQKLKNSLPPNYKLDVLTTGLNINTEYSLGMPCPFPETLLIESEGIAKNYVGLIYHGLAMHYSDEEIYLTAYFKKIVSYHPNELNRTVVVIASKNITAVNEIAQDFNVKIVHKERLPNSIFLNLIRYMAENNGLVSLDGIQTLLQAAYLGAKFFVYFNPFINKHNEDFYQEVALHFANSKESKVADVVMGNHYNYLPIEDEIAFKRVHQEIRHYFAKSFAFFENLQRKDKRFIESVDRDSITINIDSSAQYRIKNLSEMVGTANNKKCIQLYLSGKRVNISQFWLKNVVDYYTLESEVEKQGKSNQASSITQNKGGKNV